MKLARIFFLCLAFPLAGCSDTPSVAEGRTYLESRVKSESDNQIRLIKFTKTDGQSSEAFGVKAYRMDYEAEIEFGNTGTWLVGSPHVSYHFSPTQAASGSWANFGASLEGGRAVRKGEHAKISGTLTAQKTEKGWQFGTGDDNVSAEPFVADGSVRASREAEGLDAGLPVDDPQKLSTTDSVELPPDTLPRFTRWLAKQPGNGSVRSIDKVSGTPTAYSFVANAEVEFGDDVSTNDVDIHRGDRVTYRLVFKGVKETNLWSVVPNSTRLYVVGASSPRLLSQLRDAEKRNDAVRAKVARDSGCINNLRLIDAAKQQWALERGMQMTDMPSWSDIQPFLGRGAQGTLPVCPLGGVYTLNAVNQKPQCSIPGHVLP